MVSILRRCGLTSSSFEKASQPEDERRRVGARAHSADDRSVPRVA